MYKNLKAEMVRYEILQSEITELLKLSPNTVSCKFNGKNDFTLDEAMKIKNYINQKTNNDFSIDYLFENK